MAMVYVDVEPALGTDSPQGITRISGRQPPGARLPISTSTISSTMALCSDHSPSPPSVHLQTFLAEVPHMTEGSRDAPARLRSAASARDLCMPT